LTEAVASFSYASRLSDTTETWRNLHELWPESWQAQTIYLEHAITDEARFTKKDGLILLLQSLLDKNPELTNIRILMARTMRDSGQTNNALREFKRIVREGTNDITFLEEAVRLLENNNLNYEAEKVRLQIEAVQMPKLQTEE
jgi:predicted O-linked N-acetylglucosamine transferase (SPINDLY family)